jgi:hypothetical protein
MQPVLVSKILAAASSTSIGTFSSGLATTLSCATLDTARRILIWGTSAMGQAVTLTGLNAGLNQISETVQTSTVTATAQAGTATIQDFIKVTSVSFGSTAGVTSTAAYLGTNSQGGCPWQVVDTCINPINLEFDINITSPSTVVAVSFEYSMDYPEYDPNARAWDGVNPTGGPRPTISSLGSTVTLDTIGNINFPVAAWRITVTSTSSGAGSVMTSVTQAG